MLLGKRTGNFCFFLGIGISCVGLVYVLGYSDHDFFRNSAAFGFSVMATGILIDKFPEPKQ